MCLCWSLYLIDKATSAENAIYGTLHGDIIVQAGMPNPRTLSGLQVFKSGLAQYSKAVHVMDAWQSLADGNVI